MARTPRQALQQRNLNAQKGEEFVKTLENDPSLVREDMAVNPADLVTDGTFKEPAVDLESLEEDARRGPRVRRYTILLGGRVQTQRNGHRTLVNAGKIIDENNYDIQLMITQGIKLEEIVDLDSTG